MYVCHCNRIPEREIRNAIDSVKSARPGGAASPADVLLELNRFGKCLGCFPLIEAMLTGDENSARLKPVPVRVDLEDSRNNRPRRRGGAFARRNPK